VKITAGYEIEVESTISPQTTPATMAVGKDPRSIHAPFMSLRLAAIGAGDDNAIGALP
jgi:hypothetical protein